METKFKLEDYDAKIVTSVKLDVLQFDRMVKQAYGRDPEFVALQEANNNSQYEFDVSKPEKFLLFNSESQNKKAEAIRSGKYPDYSAKKIFECLVEDEFIPPAIYTVEVSW